MKNRDIGMEILEGIQAIKAGKGKVVSNEKQDIGSIREGLCISQAQFASLLGVSIRTLQEWEQDRREPSGPAKRLLEIAKRHPEIMLEEWREHNQSRKVA